ncbi:MAG: heterodisulfide reductase [Candidatus Muproteobacteria bacterium RIFCSPHIGHO2_12_FULL_60_33]|uniref:Heterodisulfide reductase n=1 Tax=Candidatus Muproteobacteria bacterium RIFCSPLOWO2_01_FULL_60_18 TaxID=1817768 RepID=A0A1F6TZ30_9PROT|nr:MAG: heterodisulfide reductase [Candidatus Muproteobacteria bacterium RIFCSPLOWO2_01_FULL_60_18]OGI50724.1 MAG: heterodisulfide reductase [Candidatus Muproteobacteria bacterium RIFCSPHIGHO2_01_60_12]OGI55217.1 MAG: heterodisulfide reductase [Candidatus Muproteobacteria bacterium RIFCSPHIGHO2_02_FULL_60_13]OGI56251.1 MAG: heterodisulfide reductase [Candidatus Muproteobacteria bacterium RIFCSPHIGHO2_12_FULL_60_33]
MADMKIGAYICKGCGIGERLDTAQLAMIAQKEGKAQVVREHEFLCNASGVDMIKNDIANAGVNHVVIAACSRRSKAETFNFENVAISRANLREGVIWITPADADKKEIVQEMAADYVRMGCAESAKMQIPAGNPSHGDNKRILVVGGGITGMTAALEASKTGYDVLLVEKTGSLGGWAAKLHKRVPYREPYTEPADTGIADLVKKIESDKHIKVFLNSTLSKTSGAPGQFSVDISTESGSTATENVGAVIMASGFTPYDMNKLPYLGAGKSRDVVDQLGLEALAKAANGGPIKRPSDGKIVSSVVFIQCAGQRSDKEGELPYCSGHCCNTSIKQAMYFKDRNPDIDTNIIYTDLRSPGNGEDFYRSAQKKGVNFTKGVVSEVATGNGALEVKFNDKILDADAITKADLVVLATGQVANSGVDIEQVPQDEPGKWAPSQQSVLNLVYRQGKDIPILKHGFNDSHFICFPYETRRTGIYTAGPVRRPMDMAQAIDDATGAALKAIQAVENASLGRAAHPRSGDLSYPIVRIEGCTQCKRCTVECPFGAIDEDEKRYPVFNESRCRRCGTCMGACPVRVISFENYSVDTVGSQIKGVDMPDQFSEKPRILVLACENDAYPALDMAAMNRFQYSAFTRVVPVRCLGSVNTIWVTDALNSGYDGVILMGCQKGDNYQCHFMKGSELAHDRMSRIDDTLKQLSLEVERVRTYEVAITDIQRAPALINEMAETIQKIGLSPLKF